MQHLTTKPGQDIDDDNDEATVRNKRETPNQWLNSAMAVWLRDGEDTNAWDETTPGILLNLPQEATQSR
jgi:hypothetical protein